jgi:hypothetical protein
LTLLCKPLHDESPRLRCLHPRCIDLFPELHGRKIDLTLARLANLPVQGRLDENLNAEVLLDDPFSAVADRRFTFQSEWKG